MAVERHVFLLAAMSLAAGLLLSIVPLPDWLAWGRPKWVALLVIYWVFNFPHRVGIGWAWVAGLLLDGLQGSLLGQNAFSLAIVAYLAMVLYQRFRMYSVWQQAFVVFVLVGLQQLIVFWISTLAGRPVPQLWFLIACVVSALIWPVMLTVMNGLQRAFR